MSAIARIAMIVARTRRVVSRRAGEGKAAVTRFTVLTGAIALARLVAWTTLLTGAAGEAAMTGFASIVTRRIPRS